MIVLNERYLEMLRTIDVPEDYWKGRTIEYMYWFRSLLQKIDSGILIKGIPDYWSDDFLKICLWSRGYVTVFDTIRWGTVFQPCTLSGYDFQYQPTTALVSNPYYSKELKIGSECELIKLTPDFMGVFDIIEFYADKLAEVTKGIDVGLINAKIPAILAAKNSEQAETLKHIYDKVQNGDPLIIWDNTDDNGEIIPTLNVFESWVQDFSKTFIVPQLQESMDKLLNSFYTEIGLPVAIEKNQHILNAEADFKAAQSQARIACWVNTLRESFKKVNELFPDVNLTVEFARNENLKLSSNMEGKVMGINDGGKDDVE